MRGDLYKSSILTEASWIFRRRRRSISAASISLWFISKTVSSACILDALASSSTLMYKSFTLDLDVDWDVLTCFLLAPPAVRTTGSRGALIVSTKLILKRVY